MAPSTRSSRSPFSRNRCTMRARVRCDVMPMPRRSLMERSSQPLLREPLPRGIELSLVWGVQAQRRERDLAILHRVKIGAGPGFLGAPGGACSFGGGAAGRVVFVARFGVVRLAQGVGLGAGDSARRD